MIDVAEAELRARLVARWEGYGLSQAEVMEKLEGNDLPNGRLVTTTSIEPEFVFTGQ